MNDFYLATIIAAVVTIVIALHVLVAGTRGSATPELLAPLRSRGARIADRVKRALDHWVAAMLARRERQAVMSILNRCFDRELRDIGLRRGDIAYGSGMGRSKLRIPAAARGTARNINTIAKLVQLASGD